MKFCQDLFIKKSQKFKKFRISELLEDLEVLKGLEVQS